MRYIVALLCMSSLALAQTPGINLNLMDRNVAPQQDFFRFVNGKWLDNTQIPADKTRWGSFDELRQNTDKDMLVIVNEALSSKMYTPDSDQGKALAYYRSVLDLKTRNAQGFKPLKPFFDKIDKIKSVADLQNYLQDMEPIGGGGFFGMGISADEKDSNKNTLKAYPGSLGLPDRDYYVSQEADSKDKREKYKSHVARMLKMAGIKNSEKAAADILELETAMAETQFTRVERRDRRLSYNPMTIKELQDLAPNFNWSQYLAAAGIKTNNIIVTQPRFFKELSRRLGENNTEAWKAYLKWTLINRHSGKLSEAIETANWEFYSKTLTGALKERPLDERALSVVNGALGEALGKLYVEKKFPPEAKAKAQKMIANVIKAFENRINNLPWMSAETRKSAIAKLEKSRVKIGYPDKWKDYSDLVVKSPEEGGTYFENSLALARWRYAENVADLQKPVDKDRWGMSPQTVNAYYNPSYNEIVFPAAILQPPFYDYKADEAVNYGGIGAVIGHEISHGFDDSGARYNAEGNLVDWWTPEDLKQFTALTGALADQYSKLEPIPGTFVDGKFTLGENIGDLGGVSAAYDGLQLHLQQEGRPANIDGFTPEQRFFISWATIWRSKMRDEAMKNMVKTDPHSPGQYRAYVPLMNVDSFYKAFDVKPGDGMYLAPDQRVKIW
ncbi:M13 family metallopeptidase [Flavobacterium aurantiibacter]|uniref:Endothelin-converting protein n=1 Tax=Flavobacterium aurantiibacter TaxID=2023067 RepID=A0A256A2D5_9FLAO|nr:M13 family metallopeptidase [Flavobacterium aurantiibacter]OYQ47799.1 endothelin-converting protein [Flavobacterium aurantiibacter]